MPDTHPAQLILLPFDTIPVWFLEKLTVSFSRFGILSHGCTGDARRAVVERLHNISEVIHDRVTVQSIQPMTDKDYTVRGCTALLDAIGGAIHHIGNIHKYARAEDVPEHTLFVITTDGMENASQRYDSEKVKKMIERQKEKHGWEFLFLGANIDAVETAKHFGISEDRAVNYHSDSEGTQLNYEVLSEAICSVRCSAPLGADWKKRIYEDYQTRKNRKNSR